MKVLITGAAGFIASHLADACIAQGHEVVIVTISALDTSAISIPKPSFMKWISAIPPSMTYLWKRSRTSWIIMQLRSLFRFPWRIRSPMPRINVKGLINILEASVKAETKKLVYISSGGAMYGEATE